MTPSAMGQPFPVRAAPWGTLASVSLHAGLAALLFLATPTRRFEAPPPHGIAVELVTAADLAAALAKFRPPPVLAVPAPPRPSELPVEVAPPSGDVMVRATHLYTAEILADPKNRQVRDTLPTLADGERIVQLCNVEGLEQIGRADAAFAPDILVPYAMNDTVLTGGVLVADGAAFRSGHDWYAIRFRCTVAANYAGVDDFEFAIGEPIPRDEWAAHSLTAADEDLE